MIRREEAGWRKSVEPACNANSVGTSLRRIYSAPTSHCCASRCQRLAERLSLSGTPTAVLPYVLITPARNEEKHIGRLLGSMVAQTHPPLKWVIVSDASTDRTEQTVSEYQQRYAWIQLLCRRAPHERSFAAKVDCFNDGLRE